VDAKIPDWVGNGKSNTPAAVKEQSRKKDRVPRRITLQRVKREWADCTIIDAFDPGMVDWLISRVETLERRLAKHREGRTNG
jgi:hypothetical protein